MTEWRADLHGLAQITARKPHIESGMRRAWEVGMRPFLPFALLVFSVGCGATITADDDGTSECGPQPESNGDCPPAWTCIDGEWVDTAGACPSCPEMEPVYGDACASIGLTCNYVNDVPCGDLTNETAECTEDGWVTYVARCEPPPECPDDMPVAGTDCTGWEFSYWCQYDVSCGGPEVSNATVSCDTSATPVPVWQVDAPSACQDCLQLGSSASCAATTGCRWLTPGCDSDLPTVNEGCYPASDCNANGCADPNATCTTYSYDPCAGADCDACAAPVGVCELLLE